MKIMLWKAKKQKECLNIKGCKTREGQSNFKFLPKDFYAWKDHGSDNWSDSNWFKIFIFLMTFKHWIFRCISMK